MCVCYMEEMRTFYILGRRREGKMEFWERGHGKKWEGMGSSMLLEGLALHRGGIPLPSDRRESGSKCWCIHPFTHLVI